MISSVLSHDDRDELLRGARSNVGLVADTIWAPIERDDSYRKLNRDLWKRICKIAASYDEITSSTRPKNNKRVRDVIPESRLSVYGDFEYEDDAEEYDETECKDVPGPIKNGGPPTINARLDDDEDDEDDDELKEPWLLDEVEEYVAWVKKAWKCRRPIGCKPLSKSDDKACMRDLQEAIINHTSTTEEKPNNAVVVTTEPEKDDFKAPLPPRFAVTSVSEAQLEGRIFSDSVRNLWRTNPSSAGPSSSRQPRHQQQLQQQEQLVRGLQRELGLLRPQPQKRSSTPSTTSSSSSSSPVASDLQQTHYSFQNERLKMPSRCQYSYVQALNMVHRPLAPLCVDVPEFFPKGPGGSASASWPIDDHRTSKPIQYYSENPYQEEMFPYKSHVQTNRKTVTVYQNTLVPMVATPIVSAMVWPSQAAAWTQQRMMPTPMQLHHQMQPPPTMQQPPAPQPPPQTMNQAPQQSAGMCPTVVHRPIRIQEAAVKQNPIQQPQPQSQTSQQQQQQQVQQQQQQQQIATSHKGQIPVYQRQTKVAQDYGQQRRKNQGVDFNNLILLTKSAMKVRRNQTKTTKKFFAESTKGLQSAAVVVAASSASKIETTAPCSSSRWFEKGSSQTQQQKREREYVTVPTSISTKMSCATKRTERDYQDTRLMDEHQQQQHHQRPDSSSAMPLSRKRLYRDVLESSPPAPSTPSSVTAVVQSASASVSAAASEESSFEKRYDELERQAMEQYRNSEECLAQRYQELEQQAMEQYRTAESSESINADFDKHSTSSRGGENEESVDNKLQENDEEEAEDTETAVNQEKSGDYSSGFGKCNLSKKANAEEEKDDQQQQQQPLEHRIKILKPDTKVHRAASEGSLRPIAVARRLNAGAGMGANSYLRDSKNTIRVASEKIVKTSSLSSLKRRLMPMSPLDRNKSGGSLMMTRTQSSNNNANSGLDPIKAVQTLDKHVATYYRNAKVFHHHHHHQRHHHHYHHPHLHHHRQTGSGDDKANNIGDEKSEITFTKSNQNSVTLLCLKFIQSFFIKVWLSDFWS